jgi:hypothetical protein
MIENGERLIRKDHSRSDQAKNFLNRNYPICFFWQGVRKKRHASEQTIRTAPQPELATLSQDDLGLREKGPSSIPDASNFFFSFSFYSSVLASGRICNS